jgi:hypothetical protein
MIDLSAVTLTSLIFDRSPEHLVATVAAMRYMRSVAKFGHAILFSACGFPDNGFLDAEIVQIPPTDAAGSQILQLKVIPRFIRTPWMMTMHDDGFIIEPSLWKPEFLQYDFIGAPWGDGVVGNEGFSLQSKKMLWAKSRLPYTETLQADEFICRAWKPVLETHCGIKFAPTELALQFSTETIGNETPSLGYHGRTHSAAKHKQAWEQVAKFEHEQNSANHPILSGSQTAG